jgi:16S rRNA (cytosine967-C5)-methyltransferase
LSADALARRCTEQREVLALAAPLARPGGRLVYVTCSVLPEENEDQVRSFLGDHPDYRLVPWQGSWSGADDLTSCSSDGNFLQLAPQTHETDGFFIAVMERRDAL